MPRTSLFNFDMADLLGDAVEPVTETCPPMIAALVCRILDWQPVTVSSLVNEGMPEREARVMLTKATAYVLANQGGNVAVAARLAALAGCDDPRAAVAASRAFHEVEHAAKRDSARLDDVRERFAALARGKK